MTEQESCGGHDQDESGRGHHRTQGLPAATPSSSGGIFQSSASSAYEENRSLSFENDSSLEPMESADFNTGDAGERMQNEWFILCHDKYKYSGKALHIPVEKDMHDVQLFRRLRQAYSSSKGWAGQHFRWTKVTKLSFVRVCLLN